jgi:hypothetical protein
MKILILLAAITAQAQVTTLPVRRSPDCRITSAVEPSFKFANQVCSEIPAKLNDVLALCFKAEAPEKDAQVLFSVMRLNLVKQEMKIILRGTPINDEDNRRARSFFTRLEQFATYTRDPKVKAELLKILADSKQAWEYQKIFDDETAESWNVDMGVARATMMYTLKKTTASPRFIEKLKENGVIEATALRMQQEELELIYSEYPEFRNLGEPNVYQTFAQTYSRLQVPEKMLSGQSDDRPECKRISRLKLDERQFCRVVAVREDIVIEMAENLSSSGNPLKMSQTRVDFSRSTNGILDQIHSEISLADRSPTKLLDETSLWTQLLQEKANAGDRSGEAYAFARRCEAEKRNAGRPSVSSPFTYGTGRR